MTEKPVDGHIRNYSVLVSSWKMSLRQLAGDAKHKAYLLNTYYVLGPGNQWTTQTASSS
jgi:hypothetical protein